MANPIFTSGVDIVDLNLFDLDALEAEGIVTNDALAGNDVVTLSETQNLGEAFNGNNGRDTITGSGAADNILGGLGTDELYGAGGSDILNGGNDVDRLYGGDGDDTLNGAIDRDFLYGENGDDDINGGAGSDYLYGGAGLDDLLGGDQSDQLFGEDGNDFLSGNTGVDVLSGGTGADQLLSGSGADVLSFAGADMDGSSDRIGDFVRGQDRVRFQGVSDASGQMLDSFGDLDTNGDGVLNGSDANVLVTSKPELTLTVADGSIVFNNIAQLGAADFEFGTAVTV